jgi:Ca2+-transporting ATPase
MPADLSPTAAAPLAGHGAPDGLSSEQARARLQRDGPNALPPDRSVGVPALILGVLREPMLLLLAGAAMLYAVLGDTSEAVLMSASVALVIGTTVFQRGRAERALRRLRDLASPTALVWRDGALTRLDARELVLGDLLVVEEGDRVPADAGIVGAHALSVDESLLTGESMPVAKEPAGPGADAAAQMLYSGTLVVAGRATARVRAVGARTRMGTIGASLGAIPVERTRTQRQLDRLVGVFATLGLAACVLVVALFWATRGGFVDAVLAGITLAIANIPEEFPVVLTIFLALGAWRLTRLQVLVRRPPVIETLGAVSVLCVDKTGTLTENRMSVQALAAEGEQWTAAAAAPPPAAFDRLLRLAALAGEPAPTDPMEKAVSEAVGGSLRPGDGTLVQRYALTPALPAKTHVWRPQGGGRLTVACKGAPETVAALCRLGTDAHARLLAEAARMAAGGLRVLAVAGTEVADDVQALPASPDGFDFALAGLVAFADPLRAEVPQAVAEARAAGVRLVMITGDHPATALAIAAAAGIDARHVTTGDTLAALDERGFAEAAAGCNVFARVTPEQKLRLVRALRAANGVVAMTGDGVNDAPALKAADVGIAMGGRGTDVAREAAQIVLLDDGFASIVAGIRNGRVIFANIRRALRYILAVHVPVAGMALAPLLLGGPLVLSPVLVVFLELIIDPACTLVFERQPMRRDVMHQAPRPAAQPIFSGGEIARALVDGLAGLAGAAAAYLLAWRAGLADTEIRALAFTAIVGGNLALLALNRDERGLGGALLADNSAFWIIVAATSALLAAGLYLPAVAAVFRFSAPAGWMAAAAFVLPGAAVYTTRQVLRGFRRDAASG